MNQFQVLKQLGSGSFGRVLKVRRKEDNSVLAMKTIKMMELNSKEKDNALNEVRLLASIDSPNVIKYKGAFFQECGNILSIIMEFADGGDLSGLLTKKTNRKQVFDENFIWKVAHDLLKGLKFLHQNNIIHRDIKTANVFFVNGVAKLGDMNVSKVVQGKFATTQTGTPYYTSPQIWQGKKYTATCDIWSLGCLLYQLCCMRPPFMAKDFPGLMKRVCSGYYDPIPSRYSRKLSSLIRKCLTPDFMKRPSANDLLQSEVFQYMNTTQQGQIDLLDTIRCPRVLKMINRQLPQNQYVQKKPKTLKLIAQDPRQSAGSRKVIGSMKSIGSQKKIIRSTSIGRKQNSQYQQPPSPQQHHQYYPPNPHYQHYQQNKVHHKHAPMQAVMQSPQGYVKLPKIGSHKAL